MSVKDPASACCRLSIPVQVSRHGDRTQRSLGPIHCPFRILTVRTMWWMRDRLKTRGPQVRNGWLWLGCGVIVVALLITGMFTVSRVFHNDPCDSALPLASELGLHLSDDDDVVSCEWHSSFPDSSGTVMVRTASHTTREALLERSGVSEEIDRQRVSLNDGPFREEMRRPNLERGDQVYIATAPNGHQLRISYDEGVESGLLLTVRAIQV